MNTNKHDQQRDSRDNQTNQSECETDSKHDENRDSNSNQNIDQKNRSNQDNRNQNVIDEKRNANAHSEKRVPKQSQENRNQNFIDGDGETYRPGVNIESDHQDSKKSQNDKR